MYNLKIITDILENIAPKELAYNWDNVGVQVGSINSSINKILICLDINEKVMEEAIKEKVQLVISHHPLIFSPIKNVTTESYTGNIITQAIKNDINIYIAHTNIDCAKDGLNTYIANLLGLNNLEILDPIKNQSYYKVAVFVPETYEEIVGNALSNSGAGHIGNYSHCSFRSTGEGTFMPLGGADPFIGKKDKLEKVKEVKIETIVPEKYLQKAIESMIDAHPYEEVAYDVYKLNNIEMPSEGIGRVGTLEDTIKLKKYITSIKEIFNTSHIKVIGELDADIKKVAIVNGSGADYISKAAGLKCDLLITGDIRYHDAQKAEELNLNVIDIGHYESELFFKDLLYNYLNKEFKKKNIDIEIINTKTDGNPFNIV